MYSQLASSVTAEQHPIEQLLLLHAITSVVSTHDLQSLEAAAQAFLTELLPGATIRHTSTVSEPKTFSIISRHVVQIPLRDGAAFTLTAPRAMGCLGPLRTATGLIAAQVEAIYRQNDLADSNRQLGQAGQLRRAMYSIASLASAASSDPVAVFADLHTIVGTLMYAKNFYIALYDADRNAIHYPYYVDSMDADPPAASTAFAMKDIVHSPTWYVIHEGMALMGPDATLRATIGSDFNSTGPRCEDWLGVPLMGDEGATGCIVVQSYDKAHCYSAQDRELLTYLAQHIEAAIELHRMVNGRGHGNKRPGQPRLPAATAA